MSNWVDYVKEFAKENNITYGCAMTNDECKRSYKLNKPPKKCKKCTDNPSKPCRKCQRVNN